jgi:hypothetical protein
MIDLLFEIGFWMVNIAAIAILFNMGYLIVKAIRIRLPTKAPKDGQPTQENQNLS